MKELYRLNPVEHQVLMAAWQQYQVILQTLAAIHGLSGRVQISPDQAAFIGEAPTQPPPDGQG